MAKGATVTMGVSMGGGSRGPAAIRIGGPEGRIGGNIAKQFSSRGLKDAAHPMIGKPEITPAGRKAAIGTEKFTVRSFDATPRRVGLGDKATNMEFGSRRVARPLPEAERPRTFNLKNLKEYNPTNVSEPKVIFKGFGEKPALKDARQREMAPRVIVKELPSDLGRSRPSVEVRPRTKPVVGNETPAQMQRITEVRSELAKIAPKRDTKQPEVSPVLIKGMRLEGLTARVVQEQRTKETKSPKVDNVNEKIAKPTVVVVGEGVAFVVGADGIYKVINRPHRHSSPTSSSYLKVLAERESLKQDEKEEDKAESRQHVPSVLQRLRTKVSQELRILTKKDAKTELKDVTAVTSGVRQLVIKEVAQITPELQPKVAVATAPLEQQITRTETQLLAAVQTAPAVDSTNPMHLKAPAEEALPEPRPKDKEETPDKPFQLSVDQRALNARIRGVRTAFYMLLTRLAIQKNDNQRHITGCDLAVDIPTPNPENTSSIVRVGEDGSYSKMKNSIEGIGATPLHAIVPQAETRIFRSRPVQRGPGANVSREEVITVINRSKESLVRAA